MEFKASQQSQKQIIKSKLNKRNKGMFSDKVWSFTPVFRGKQVY